MVPYLETGLQPPFPTVPYLETGGSNGSLFRKCLQPPVQRVPFQKLIVPMVPYLETGLQPLFP